MDADLLHRRVKVHDDDQSAVGVVTYVATHTDPVTHRTSVEAVSVRTDAGDDWAGIPIRHIELI